MLAAAGKASSGGGDTSLGVSGDGGATIDNQIAVRGDGRGSELSKDRWRSDGKGHSDHERT